ncbi:hypothetical protein PRK78_007277 [Emydomyces testavorans]|uniref:Uncharacterized protein n=1 Tax=Emydomyces testavorans TaxID=2070801 RepID=A0AAF0IMJ0_9EURO|nr:hypothetical protein PRK78_007277 [Emydomyces testavorans]
MGLSHIGICVPHHKFNKTLSFYLAALAPLGYKELMRPVDNVVGLGIYYPEFWISGVNPDPSPTEHEHEHEHEQQQKPIHIAFQRQLQSQLRAKNDRKARELVHAFYDAALKSRWEV